MKNKRITVNDKLISKINLIVATHLGLSSKHLKNLQSFNLNFDNPSDLWSENENEICDYTSSCENAIMEDIEKLLRGD